MAEVIRANKEKAKAEKKERELLRSRREQDVREGISETKVDLWGDQYVPGASAADVAVVLSRGPPEPPKDRSLLAAMRVIRRNLVYVVGIPSNIASEELLRKPEYFGQYGKIAKIVINRNSLGEPRRASASAYVTFVYKEDTLACILALDGFYHDGRNIRASYGTSKYCSAFIKSVKCNNPDCTYLHHMGDTEDTFTKQEIQAGYVTSGRDVLARQQQIMVHIQNASENFGKKIVGCGGPSGTGKASANPILPPPTFSEPTRTSLRNLRYQVERTPAASALSSFASSASNICHKPAVPASHAALTSLNHTGSEKSIEPVDSSLDLSRTECMILKKQQETVFPQNCKETISVQQCYDDKEFSLSFMSFSIGLTGAIQHGENGVGEHGAGSLSPEFDVEDKHVSGSGALGGEIINLSPGRTQSGVIGGVSLAPSNDYFSLQFFGSMAHSHDRLLAKAESIYSVSEKICDGDNQSCFQNHSNPVPIGPSNKDHQVAGTSLLCSAGSSSTLASILGIELPTGLGSLRESSETCPNLDDVYFNPSANVGLLNCLSENIVKPSGMLPIAAPPGAHGNEIGSYEVCGINNDVTLLQSLLPGVNITTSSSSRQVGIPKQDHCGGGNWNCDHCLSTSKESDNQKRYSHIW
eukprot:scaffold36759_cov22-Cyclotella_meneghiniana.AAC.1